MVRATNFIVHSPTFSIVGHLQQENQINEIESQILIGLYSKLYANTNNSLQFSIGFNSETLMCKGMRAV